MLSWLWRNVASKWDANGGVETTETCSRVPANTAVQAAIRHREAIDQGVSAEEEDFGPHFNLNPNLFTNT